MTIFLEKSVINYPVCNQEIKNKTEINHLKNQRHTYKCRILRSQVIPKNNYY